MRSELDPANPFTDPMALSLIATFGATVSFLLPRRHRAPAVA